MGPEIEVRGGGSAAMVAEQERRQLELVRKLRTGVTRVGVSGEIEHAALLTPKVRHRRAIPAVTPAVAPRAAVTPTRQLSPAAARVTRVTGVIL